MSTLSEHFGLNRTQAELDFVDVPIDGDLALFVDPFAFTVRDDAWSFECNESVLSFFSAALDCVRRGNDARGQLLLDKLSEPNETHLGLSSGRPQGRGVSGKQALDLYEHLKDSKAAQTGILSELADCDLFVEGIGPDKISDITTNIIRAQLISYTREQCKLHGIPLRHGVPSGRVWNFRSERWEELYVDLPVVHSTKLLLVPKASVRWSLSFSPQKYYRHFVLTYLQSEFPEQSLALAEALRRGARYPTKKELEEEYPFSKGFLAEFSQKHPDVLDEYKKAVGVPREISNEELLEGFDSGKFAGILKEKLRTIPPGPDHATDFHLFILGVLEFIFYPDLIYPQSEFPIHQGRKIIDIKFTNAAREGFFFGARFNPGTRAINVFTECKNYSHDPANPELDQLSGRFAPQRGRLGLLVARDFKNRELFVRRCRDTVHDDRGFIIPLVDNDVLELLDYIEQDTSDEIGTFFVKRFDEITT